MFEPENQSHPNDNSQSSLWEICPQLVPIPDIQDEEIIKDLKHERPPSTESQYKSAAPVSKIPRKPAPSGLKESESQVQNPYEAITRSEPSGLKEKRTKNNDTISEVSRIMIESMWISEFDICISMYIVVQIQYICFTA